MKCPGCDTEVIWWLEGEGLAERPNQERGYVLHDRARCDAASGRARLVAALERLLLADHGREGHGDCGLWCDVVQARAALAAEKERRGN